MDLSWFTVISSIISILAIVTGAVWTLEPIQVQTHAWLGIFAFVPLFLFRMLSWLIIITFLDSFSMFVLVGIVILTWVLLFFIQDRLHVEPLKQTLLSVVFPVVKMPSGHSNSPADLKLLIWLVVSGNLFFMLIIITLFCLYYFEVYDPWCSKVKDKITVPQSMLVNIFIVEIILFVTSTIPVIVAALRKIQRRDKSIIIFINFIFCAAGGLAVLLTPSLKGVVEPKCKPDTSSGLPVLWNGQDWALYCDFEGQDMSRVKVTSDKCGPSCLETPGCTHFTWTSFEGGTCMMKNGLVSKADAFGVSNSDYVCGVNYIEWNKNNEAVACDFTSKILTSTHTLKYDCSANCSATTNCSHYHWRDGVCKMFAGEVKKFDALYTGDLVTFCGITTATGTDIIWNDKWAFNCDFEGNDIGNVQVPGEECSNTCAAHPGCTHFMWSTFNGGTCWMKSGDITKEEAVSVDDSMMVCGIL